MKALEQFKHKQYLSLETFRKNGTGVRTPVWFVQDGETLYVLTVADSGKAKRIRREGRANIATCRVDGKVTGTWVRAWASEVTDPGVGEKIDRLLDRKYCLLKRLFERQRAKKGLKDTFLEIKLEQSQP